MSVRRAWGAAIVLLVAGAMAEAGEPKPVSMVDRVTTSQSRGAYGLREGKYNRHTWGNRWKQSLGRAPVIVSPYVRSL